jgi:hypothetical protein
MEVTTNPRRDKLIESSTINIVSHTRFPAPMRTVERQLNLVLQIRECVETLGRVGSACVLRIYERLERA